MHIEAPRSHVKAGGCSAVQEFLDFYWFRNFIKVFHLSKKNPGPALQLIHRYNIILSFTSRPYKWSHSFSSAD